jgi:hypothetical protein
VGPDDAHRTLVIVAAGLVNLGAEILKRKKQ